MRAKLIAILFCGCLLATIALIAQDIPQDELHWGSRACRFVSHAAGCAGIRGWPHFGDQPRRNDSIDSRKHHAL
jgi:hypothetical protein